MTILRKLAAIAAATVCTSVVHAADINVNFASVAGTNVNGVNFSYDGDFPSAGQEWTTNTAWWTGFDKSLVFHFDQTYIVKSFDVSLDNNDSYAVEFSMDGDLWGSTISIDLGEGNVGWGMDRFQRSLAPTMANYARVFATNGDNMYSVGELKITAAVPEPETYAMMLSGLGLLGIVAKRRRKQKSVA